MKTSSYRLRLPTPHCGKAEACEFDLIFTRLDFMILDMLFISSDVNGGQSV